MRRGSRDLLEVNDSNLCAVNDSTFVPMLYPLLFQGNSPRKTTNSKSIFWSFHTFKSVSLLVPELGKVLFRCLIGVGGSLSRDGRIAYKKQSRKCRKNFGIYVKGNLWKIFPVLELCAWVIFSVDFCGCFFSVNLYQGQKVAGPQLVHLLFLFFRKMPLSWPIHCRGAAQHLCVYQCISEVQTF